MDIQAPPQTVEAEPRAAGFAGWHDSSLELKLGLVVTEHGTLNPWDEVSPWHELGQRDAAGRQAQP